MSRKIGTSAGNGGSLADRPTDKYKVKGTDLGYLFEGGKGSWVGGVFGDTFNKADPMGKAPAGGDQWRSPVMGRTSNTDFLTSGVKWDNFAGSPNNGGTAKQIFPYNHVGSKGRLGSGNFDAFTIIPNDIVQVPDGRYFGMGFRVADWKSDDNQAMCHTISNAWFWSDEPNAETWKVGRYRDNLNRLYEWGSQVNRNRYFQNSSFLMVPNDDYLYVFGSREGRKLGTGAEADGIYLRRAHFDACFTDTEWEYWGYTGGKWQWGRNVAPTAVITPSTLGTSIGELNAQYIAGKVVLTYCDAVLGAVARVADAPDASWSAPTVLVSRIQSPAQYAPSVHPWNTDLSHSMFHLSTWAQVNIPQVNIHHSLNYGTESWVGSLISDTSEATTNLDAESLSLDVASLDHDDRVSVLQDIVAASAEVNPETK